MENRSYFEKALYFLRDKAVKHKYPLITSIITGLLCYMFFFVNKLAQQDELAAIFGKGMSLTGGRWGLELISTIFPDYSMPWIYGAISIIFIAASACVVIESLQIENRILQCVFSALFTASPSVTGIFTQPYLSAANTLAILLSVIAIKLFIKKNIRRWIAGIVLLAFSLSMYQGYISLSASIAIVILIKDVLICKKETFETIKYGIRLLLLLLASVALYALITVLVILLFNVQLNTYGISNYGILMRLRVAYTAFAGYFIKGYFSFVSSTTSLVFHIICIVLTAVIFIRKCIERKSASAVALSWLLLILLPLSINCMYLASSVDVMSAIVFMSFNSIYLLMIVLIDNSSCKQIHMRGAVSLGLSLIIVCNIYFANKISLKMYLQTEELRSYYTTLMTNVVNSGEFKSGEPLCIIGTPKGTYMLDEIDSKNFIGLTAENVYDIYTKTNYIRYYLGYDFQDVSFDWMMALKYSPEFAEMPCYPEPGSIKNISGTTVVKLSE